MPEQPEAASFSSSEPPVHRGSDYRVVFANHSRVRVSPTEITISFGYLDDIPGEAPSVQEKVTLVLTPTHTKLLSVSLKAILDLFEAQYGRIKMEYPPGQLDMTLVREAIEAAKK